jgi:hypothetical protein
MVRLREFVRYPFTADPWVRTAEILVHPFGALASLALVIVRRRGTADRTLLWPTQTSNATATAGRVFVRGLIGVVLGSVAALVVGYAWLIVPVNLGYPLRPDTDDLSNAWGGPTMAGAWAVHAAGGLLFVWVAALIARALSGDQPRASS